MALGRTFPLVVSSLTILLAAISACRTGSNAAVKEDQGAADGGFRPPSATWRKVAARDIDQALLPASHLPGNLAKLNGVFYCKSPLFPFGLSTGAVIIDMHNSYVVDDTLVFGVYEPLVYAWSTLAAQYSGVTDKQPLSMPSLSYGQIKFLTDTHAELYFYTYKAGVGLVPQDRSKQDLTLDYLETGHFIRKSTINRVKDADYDLVQIVDEDGHRTHFYDDTYLKDLGQSKGDQVLILVPAGSPLESADPVVATAQSLQTSNEQSGGGKPQLLPYTPPPAATAAP